LVGDEEEGGGGGGGRRRRRRRRIDSPPTTKPPISKWGVSSSSHSCTSFFQLGGRRCAQSGLEAGEGEEDMMTWLNR